MTIPTNPDTTSALSRGRRSVYRMADDDLDLASCDIAERAAIVSSAMVDGWITRTAVDLSVVMDALGLDWYAENPTRQVAYAAVDEARRRLGARCEEWERWALACSMLRTGWPHEESSAR